ncbi:MAG: S46 family peptidase [Planctomycetes bacterium]|nr:S46 family peptidase [Planctomycetota bacterium]
MAPGGTARCGSRLGSLLVISIIGAGPLAADEGMWPFNELPLEMLRDRHGFVPPAGWAEHLMKSAVRVGASASFVSPDGLVLTNHHVGCDAISKLSTPERDLMRDGFVARTREEELRSPDMEMSCLVSIEDVTARVEAEVPAGADPAAANRARREAIARIEKASKDATGLRSEVVTLYRGALHHLYRYRRYDDVRLVMAPEESIAFFGGDRDNFEYPRFDLDMCLFRVYERGKPAKIDDYLRVDPRGVREGDLIFVAGHPARTQRQYTVDHMRFLRDVEFPWHLADLARREVTLEQYVLRGGEQARLGRDDLFGIQNSRKARRGIQAGLLDPAILADRIREEAALRSRVAVDPNLGASPEDWDRIAEAARAFGAFYDEYQLIEASRGIRSRLFGIARTLVRKAEEDEKPDAERIEGFREAERESLEMDLYSPAPIHAALERVNLADSFVALAAHMGAEHPLVTMILAGRSPEDRAADLVGGTKLADVGFRREVAKGGTAAIRSSTDPMIALARAVDPYARALRRKNEDLVEGVQQEAYGRIARARFAIDGTHIYPDATGTLRLAVGIVKGFDGRDGRIPFRTTIAGAFDLFDSHEGRDPYALPPSWIAARKRLDPSTPFNFISTADIIGGNSGSPVVNRAGRLVGLIFDGNLEGLVWDIVFTEEKGRAVAVSIEAILEALRKVYGADALADEIEGKVSSRSARG